MCALPIFVGHSFLLSRCHKQRMSWLIPWFFLMCYIVISPECCAFIMSSGWYFISWNMIASQFTHRPKLFLSPKDSIDARIAHFMMNNRILTWKLCSLRLLIKLPKSTLCILYSILYSGPYAKQSGVKSFLFNLPIILLKKTRTWYTNSWNIKFDISCFNNKKQLSIHVLSNSFIEQISASLKIYIIFFYLFKLH